jgi:hypothetical protein
LHGRSVGVFFTEDAAEELLLGLLPFRAAFVEHGQHALPGRIPVGDRLNPSASPRRGEFSAEENVRSAGWSLDFAASV